MELTTIHGERSIGKTPTLKRQSRESDSDVEFILDGDTVLESDNYIDRVVEELYKGAGIASACGTVLPLRDRDRRAMLEKEGLKKFLGAHPEATIYPKVGWFHHLQRGITDLYRDVLYFFLQKFVYHGQMAFFGSILNPVGCAVAYRRSVIKTIVFDRYEPSTTPITERKEGMMGCRRNLQLIIVITSLILTPIPSVLAWDMTPKTTELDKMIKDLGPISFWHFWGDEVTDYLIKHYTVPVHEVITHRIYGCNFDFKICSSPPGPHRFHQML